MGNAVAIALAQDAFRPSAGPVDTERDATSASALYDAPSEISCNRVIPPFMSLESDAFGLSSLLRRH